jgi:hypothetical protein
MHAGGAREDGDRRRRRKRRRRHGFPPTLNFIVKFLLFQPNTTIRAKIILLSKIA